MCVCVCVCVCVRACVCLCRKGGYVHVACRDVVVAACVHILHPPLFLRLELSKTDSPKTAPCVR